MTRSISVCAVVMAVSLAAPAAQTDPDFSAERFKAHVRFLADDLLQGREAGTRGHEIAARYIASQFATLGATPGGTDGSYFQQVDLLEVARAGPRATLTLRGPRGSRRFLHGDNVLIRGPLTGGRATVQGPLVFVGYGMCDTALGYDDYAGLDVRGKIVVALWGSPSGIDSEIGAHLLREQKRVAAAHGATGFIAVPSRVSAKAFPWRQLRLSLTPPVVTWVRKNGVPFDASEGLRASVTIETAAAAALFEGAPATMAQVLDEADRPGGRPRGFPLASAASVSVTTSVRQFTSPEVIGVIEGADPQLKNEYVALMAHADHIGLAASGATDRINNGALDNAAGVATLLEVTRALKQAATPPRRSILIVANTAEEKGLLGAEYFAAYPPVPIERITAAIDLDMPMLLYDFTDVVGYGAIHSTLGEALRKAGAEMGVALAPDPMPEQAVFVRSDHYAMAKAGVPAVMMATGMSNGGTEAWGRFLSQRYHQPSDDLSQPIRWSAGAKFAELNYRVMRILADATGRARWYEGDYFGRLFAPGAETAPRPTAR